MKELLQHLENAICEYKHITKEELENRIMKSNNNMIAEWNNKKDIKQFYKDSNQYLYDLVFFNDANRVLTLIYSLRGITDKNILDFGAGIGEIGMQFSQFNSVDYFDICEESKSFAKFLSVGTNRPINIIETEEELYKKKYDVLILVDVLEHIEDPIGKTKELLKLVKSNGLILTTGLQFKIADNIPFHLKKNAGKNDEFQNLLFNDFEILFFHSTPNETIYLWRKKK